VLIRATWQLSTAVAVALLGGWLLLTWTTRPALRRLRAFCLQFGVVVAIFAVYQRVAYLNHHSSAGALRRAQELWDLEQSLHLPSELWLQRLFLPYPLLVRGLNGYYAGVHLMSMVLFLVWMWWRQRRYYTLACVTAAATTLICVLVQRVPVAPPRLMPQLGFVDTALRYGQSVYGPHDTGIADQLAAMPSIHVAWAALITAFVVVLSSSRWRWLLVAHLVMTVLAVTATANHWWLDGVVGAAIAGLVWFVAFLILFRRLPRRPHLVGQESIDYGPARAASG
jgi:hypothetical protein